ncbi:MAG: hypothetical protein IKO47_12750 [Ruminococcus sp.]|nr:hypothetical protein [Ruminococcus sp.]
MKRIIAALLACTVITGAFVSCGSESSSSEGTASAGSESQADYCGKWKWDSDQYFNIDSDGVIKMEVAIPADSMMTFNSDGSGDIGGVGFGPGEFDYDGETYRLHIGDANDMTLKRLEPNDGTEFYGVYRLESGTLYEGIARGYNNRAVKNGDDTEFGKEDIELRLDIGEGRTNVIVLYTIGELLPDDRISFTISGETLGGTYSVDGDVMTVNSDAGNSKELKRVK